MSSHILDPVKAVVSKIPNPIGYGDWLFLAWKDLPPYPPPENKPRRFFSLRLWRFVFQVRETKHLLFSARNGFVKFRLDLMGTTTIIIDWRPRR